MTQLFFSSDDVGTAELGNTRVILYQEERGERETGRENERGKISDIWEGNFCLCYFFLLFPALRVRLRSHVSKKSFSFFLSLSFFVRYPITDLAPSPPPPLLPRCQNRATKRRK